MAHLNRKTPPTQGFTYEGAPAARIKPIDQLRRLVLAALLWEDQFYVDGRTQAEMISDLAAEIDPDAAMSLALEARNQGKLRHVPLLLAAELAKRRVLRSEVLAGVIQRPDELGEFLALYWRDKRRPLSKAVKRGLGQALRQFDEYQLSKWNRAADIRIRDVMFLVHAKPRDEEQAALWKRLADDKLAPADTWERKLSQGGGRDKGASWQELIEGRRLGGLAILRNLRNMSEAGVPRDLIRQAIRQGDYRKVLPFRFVAAARHAMHYEPELEEAMLRNLHQDPALGGRTVVLVDHSQSMRAPLSMKSDMTRWDAGAALAMIARETFPEVRIFVFSAGPGIRIFQRHSSPTSVSAEVVPRRGFALRDAMTQAMAFGGTLLGQALTEVAGVGYDRIIVLTDEQSADQIPDPEPGARGYMINVAAYQNGVGYRRWTHIDGFSENVFAFIKAAEQELR